MAAKGAACRPQAAVSLQECGGWGEHAGSYRGAYRRLGEEVGATLPYLTKGNVATVTAENYRNGGINLDTDVLHPNDDYEEYNRRITDYGNGRIEIATYHSPRLRYMGSVVSGKAQMPSNKEPETSDKAQEERTRQQVHAIRRKIKGYALSNCFRWFVTLTFDPEKVDSSDYETAKTTLLKWCRWMRDSHGCRTAH